MLVTVILGVAEAAVQRVQVAGVLKKCEKPKGFYYFLRTPEMVTKKPKSGRCKLAPGTGSRQHRYVA